MSKFFLLLGLLFLQSLSCDKEITTDIISSEAILRNNIAVDGCEWHITINQKNEWVQFATSDASKSKVDAVISQADGQNGVWSINIKLDYKFTSKKKEIQCGWGKKQSMEEIEVVNIKKQ